VLPETVYPPFANDENELIKSWEKLLATGCSVFYPGHGKPFSRDKFRKSFEKKKR
jgi:glyoxylase-like metal-dependent hydrolase (beta-lactamase superfamily II)